MNGGINLKEIYKPKKWICHCNLEVFDGKENITSKPTEIVYGKSESKAIAKLKEVFNERYGRMGCSINKLFVVLIKEI